MFDPVSTYRIQFHKGFNFSDLERILPYLQKLGVRTIYASPIFSAVPGSVHGYDVTDALSINPEIGTLEQLYDISERLQGAGMYWIQDIVPNHMAVHPDNKWLMDVFRYGRESVYASFFDIDWGHPDTQHKIMVPLLAAQIDDLVKEGKVMLLHEEGELVLQCDGLKLPVASRHITDAKLTEINSDRQMLKAIIDQQHYLLCPSASADHTMNYRRFFTINGLIGLNMQDEKVFADYHALIATLCADGVFRGLRVDHIDGLSDPGQYLHRLRELTGEDTYVVVEKILEADERLPEHWPVAGTTGYDFLVVANNVFTNGSAKATFTEFYNKKTKRKHSLSDLRYEKKSLILHQYMGGELDSLVRIARKKLFADRSEWMDITDGMVREVISEFLVRLPVYRFYGTSFPLGGDERDAVGAILLHIEEHNKKLSAAVKWLRNVLLIIPARDTEEHNTLVAAFYKRCMQFSGPLMAKGIEDTLMYSYNRFIGHNEVGDSPSRFGMAVEDYHKYMVERCRESPMSMNATSTHDTKRGEDARARLNALTDLGETWTETVWHWHKTEPFLPGHFSEEYLIYQAIVASFPLATKDEGRFRDRFREFLTKAVREAKEYTSWSNPDAGYENSVMSFADKLLGSKSFVASVRHLLNEINEAAALNSLGQVVLKFTSPGIPDIYQGNELWNISMVDPDNRLPVDYELRSRLLDEVLKGDPDIKKLWRERDNGKVKLLLTHLLLEMRNDLPELFAKGKYIPLQTRGKYHKNIVAYARVSKQACCLVVVPVNPLVIANKQGCTITDMDWHDTTVELPAMPKAHFDNIFSAGGFSGTSFAVQDLFKEIPIAVITAKMSVNNRGCGVLMPVFSLPSRFGIGDMGPGAHQFIDFLYDAGQKYWQLLPLNPVKEKQGYSPYNSTSGMACNIFYISPELLQREGLLGADTLKDYYLPSVDVVDYEKCEHLKRELINIAYTNFIASGNRGLQREFRAFCDKQAYWLDNYSLYVAIRDNFAGAPWYRWPDPYRKRSATALRKIADDRREDIERTKWLQFIINRQWMQLRARCTERGIALIGDIPFYMSTDSADVWANPEIFCIDDDGKMIGVAGVPPDYFSETGQLWNMPTYDWNALKANRYKWWIDRLKRNLELFDKVRLDHFRAFEAYWEVPAGKETAQVGVWKKGPGMDFFREALEQLGSLPFIAEDLGDNMEEVYALRERTGLPGMKVLQFAWGENMPVSVDAPHNHRREAVVYTGTHDNNTTLGWFRKEVGKQERKRIKEYTGITASESNINELMMRLAYSSVADTAIIPIQDILDLGQHSRVNTPGSADGNWLFRMRPDVLTDALAARLKRLAAMYNRQA